MVQACAASPPAALAASGPGEAALAGLAWRWGVEGREALRWGVDGREGAPPLARLRASRMTSVHVMPAAVARTRAVHSGA